MASPPHPGEIVRQECLVPLGLSVSDGATALGVTPSKLEELVAERSVMTPEMAIRLEKAFGSSADMWMRLQAAFDLAGARRREGDIRIGRFVPAPGGQGQAGSR